MSLSTEVQAEDVLAALSAFPTPPSHIPASPAVSSGASSSNFSLSRERDRNAPPSSFTRSSTMRPGPVRRDSEMSVGSAYSAQSATSGQSVQSGKLSLRVNGHDIEQTRKSMKDVKRDSGSGSSTSSGLMVNGSLASMLPSPMSGRTYFTAPSSPLPPNAPCAGPSSAVSSGMGIGTRSSSSSSLNTPSSAYPVSTSSASAYPSSSPSSAYPYSPTYTSRYAYPVPSASTRTALSMLSSTTAAASTSSSPSSMHVPISAVGMSPIEERDERDREKMREGLSRRQSSMPPSTRRRSRFSRSKAESESGSEIGGPPTVPLPPVPSMPEPGDSSSATPRGKPPSVKSLPSLRSGRKTTSHGHDSENGRGRRESGVSVMSTASGASAFSSVASSLAELGVAVRFRAGSEPGKEVETKNVADERPKGTPRAGTVPLRIDIPPTLAQEKERPIARAETIDKPLGSGNSLASPSPRELGGSRGSSDRGPDGEKAQSPTASLFSVASGATTRSGGMTTAQILKTRVSGILEGIPGVSPPTGTPVRVQRLQKATSTSLHPPASSANMCDKTGSAVGESNGLLTAEDLNEDLLLARAVSPLTPGEYGGSASSASLELSTTTRALRERIRDGPSALTVPSLTSVPPLSDVEMDGNESEKGDGEPRLSSESLLGQFPSAPITRPPPTSYPFPASSSHTDSSLTPTSASSSSSNIILRTMSQSRRKPLPAAPRGLRSSPSSINTFGRDSSSIVEDAVDGVRGRGSDRDGAGSPDITTMINKTPRPALRSKSLSVRSSRSSKSLSTRSSSIKSSNRERTRPSLPDESERQKALSRFSALSSSSSASLSRMSSLKSNGMSMRRSAGSEFINAYGGIDEDAEANVDYGIAIARHRGGYDLSPRLDSNIDEFGAIRNGHNPADFFSEEADSLLGGVAENGSPDDEESDSDIDLHTPLPHILLREGVLSPHSKVLASLSSGSLSSRNSIAGTGRDSVASYATNASFGSVMTKTGLFKDERNTERRRRRHRDGKLLREGLGLTTGLGWSDSEDEDAPSPFTNRVTSMTLSRNASMASVRSGSSKKSQFFSRSTPSSEAPSRAVSSLSGRPNILSSRTSRSPSEPHPLSKSYSSVNLAQRRTGPQEKLLKSAGEERRSMSPTSSSTTSLPFPPTPRDDVHDSSDENLPSMISGRDRTVSRTSSGGARTPTAGSLKPRQSVSSLRARSVTSSKSTPPSRLPSTGASTPRPLRLPVLQQQKSLNAEDGLKLQPGQPTPGSGSILGYNRNLHDRQRAQLLSAPKSAPIHGSGDPPDIVSPAISQKSAPSTYGDRRAYGSMPTTSSLQPPASATNSTSRLREPSPSRLSTPMTGLARPRTGTGMAYRQSSMPASPVGTAI
ncbi:hypothetical protein A7U60_g4187 [Sanghuangporus baumii]|uniref:Uncharacterized protein n=1 Tax=Sanghuangporus baumii TaxID=108892 RepID=A0A9Q5N5S4_SANBA|nr:hypothetical protein A7U60_g4187 [Sanghuangporus baumii]